MEYFISNDITASKKDASVKKETYASKVAKNQEPLRLTPRRGARQYTSHRLTPLNADTKFSTGLSPTKGRWVKASALKSSKSCDDVLKPSDDRLNRLYEMPTKTISSLTPFRSVLRSVAKPDSDLNNLPSLPDTPSPPRIKKYVASSLKYASEHDPLYHYGSNQHFNDFFERNQNYHYYDDENWRNRYPQYPPYQHQKDYSLERGRNDENDSLNKTSDSYSFRAKYSRNNKAPRFHDDESDTYAYFHGRYSAQCKYWAKGAFCKNGEECAWSHATKCDDTRKKVTNYKTKPCVDPGRGLKCEYGDRCNFAHPGEALRRPMPIEYIDKQYFKLLLRDCPTNRYPFGIFV
jgi:hypothetical protein